LGGLKRIGKRTLDGLFEEEYTELRRKGAVNSPFRRGFARARQEKVAGYMDFLRYLDVLIGLTVVMILLSPAVTAITQIIMFVFNQRSGFLKKGLAALICQLDAPSIEEWPADRRPEHMGRNGRNLKVRVWERPTDYLRTSKPVTMAFVPQGAQPAAQMETAATDVNGVATLSRVHAGPMRYTTETAIVSVLGPNGQAAVVTCIAKTGSKTGVPVSLQGGKFIYSPVTEPVPAEYEIECKVTCAGVALPNHFVRFNFERNSSCDVIRSETTDKFGIATFRVPGLDEEMARTIAGAVLQHPIICKTGIEDRKGFWASRRDPSGEVIQRDELIRILLEFAAGEGAGKIGDPERKVLGECLRLNGLPNPGQSLSNVRAEAQRLEKEDPNTPAHLRASKAIIAGAQSDFVGRVNGWFDQTMDRIGERFRLQARFLTVFAALVVAFGIQFDSFELLRRLSVDDKLRNSLVEQAKGQQSRIEQLSKPDAPKNPDELEALKASRDEIEASLTKLRSPQLAILPDHFIWQKVPEARLESNPLWKSPYPKEFELLVGSTSYTITPHWRGGFLRDLKDALDSANVPVVTSFEAGGESFLLMTKKVGQARLVRGSGKLDLLTPLVDLARAELVVSEKLPNPLQSTGCLVLDKGGPEKPIVATGQISLNTTKREEVIPQIQHALAKNSDVAVWSNNTELRITAGDPDVQEIRLLHTCDDPFSNILQATKRITRAGTVSAAKVHYDGQQLELQTDDGDVARSGIWPLKGPDWFFLKSFQADALVITSRRLGALQLRYERGEVGSNILNKPVNVFLGAITPPSFWGLVLSWVLLSLGAPFWYDALKDFLKLRGSLAGKEETQRKDRQEQQTPAAKAPAAAGGA
jgi:hypothetical protein